MRGWYVFVLWVPKRELCDLHHKALIKKGGDLLSHFRRKLSALRGLTSLFGMGRGGTPSL